MAPIIFDEFETMKWLGLVSRAEPTLAMLELELIKIGYTLSQSSLNFL